MRERTILLHPAAPAKPPVGAPCNGCGVCCAAEACPLGIVVSRRRSGPCAALRWDEDERRHVCGVVAAPREHLRALPAGLARRLAMRWIAAGSGCDATIEVLSR